MTLYTLSRQLKTKHPQLTDPLYVICDMLALEPHIPKDWRAWHTWTFFRASLAEGDLALWGLPAAPIPNRDPPSFSSVSTRSLSSSGRLCGSSNIYSHVLMAYVCIFKHNIFAGNVLIILLTSRNLCRSMSYCFFFCRQKVVGWGKNSFWVLSYSQSWKSTQ